MNIFRATTLLFKFIPGMKRPKVTSMMLAVKPDGAYKGRTVKNTGWVAQVMRLVSQPPRLASICHLNMSLSIVTHRPPLFSAPNVFASRSPSSTTGITTSALLDRCSNSHTALPSFLPRFRAPAFPTTAFPRYRNRFTSLDSIGPDSTIRRIEMILTHCQQDGQGQFEYNKTGADGYDP